MRKETKNTITKITALSILICIVIIASLKMQAVNHEISLQAETTDGMYVPSGRAQSQKDRIIDNNDGYKEFNWQSYLMDSKSISNGARYIYTHNIYGPSGKPEFNNLFCVKEGMATSERYRTIDGNTTEFLIGKVNTPEKYNRLFNMLANVYDWTGGTSDGNINENKLNEYISRINQKYQRNFNAKELRNIIITTEYTHVYNAERKYEMLELMIKNAQQMAIWDYTETGEQASRDRLCAWFNAKNLNPNPPNNNYKIIDFIRCVYDYTWYCQELNVTKSINKDEYSLLAQTVQTDEGEVYSRDNVKQVDGGILVGPVTVNNPGKYNIKYKAIILGKTYDGDNIKVANAETKGNSDSINTNGDIYIWINTQDIGDDAASIYIEGYIDFGTLKQVTFLKSQKYNEDTKQWVDDTSDEQGQNLVNISERTDNHNIGVNLKLNSIKEFDLRLTVNIDTVFSKNLYQREHASAERDDDTQLGYRTMFRTNTLGKNNKNTEEYKTNKAPVSVINGNIIKYRIRVSNEGELDGTASKVAVYIPEGLEFVDADSLGLPGNSAQYNWQVQEHEYSKEHNKNYTLCISDFGKDKSIAKYNVQDDEISYMDIFIYCRVKEDVTTQEILQLVAEIEEDKVTEENHKDVNDRDSEPHTIWNLIQGKENLEGSWRGDSNNPKVEGLKINEDQIFNGKQDDDDFESITVQAFDLALTKTITAVKAGRGKEIVYDREEWITSGFLDNSNAFYDGIYCFDKSPIQVTKNSIITYKMTVYNEGQIDGYAKEITDYIPDSLVVCDDNGNEITEGSVTCTVNGKQYLWTVKTLNDGSQIVTTNSIAKQIIRGFYGREELDSASVFIKCKAKKASSEKIINVAEITKYGYLIDAGGEFVEASRENIDRDSVQNTFDNTVTDRFTDELKNQITKVKNYTSDYENKTSYDNQDDDDFECVTISDVPPLDLALRLYISSNNGKKITKMETMEASEEISLEHEGEYGASKKGRAPSMTNETYEYGLKQSNKSGAYYHAKQAILTDNNKDIEYTVEVYNEGEENVSADGMAKSITIDIQKGLTFKGFKDGIKENEFYYSNANKNIGYKAKIQKNSDGSSKLNVEIVNPIILSLNGGTNIEKYFLNPGTVKKWADKKATNSDLNHNDMKDVMTDDNGDVQKFSFICSVDNDAYGYLNCVAEIDNMYALYNDNVYSYDRSSNTLKSDTLEIKEKDSTPRNVSYDELTGIGMKTTLANWYYSKVNITYVEPLYIADNYSTSPNEEDDTDFETVLVSSPTRVYLKKVDENGNEIQDSNLEITVLLSNDSEIKGTRTYKNNGDSRLATDYIEMKRHEGAKVSYLIEEKEAPEGKINVLRDKRIIVQFEQKDGELVTTSWCIDPFGNKVDSIWEYVTVSDLKFTDGIYYVDVEIKNPEKHGEYGISLLKTCEGNPLPEVRFNIKKDGELILSEETGENGKIEFNTFIENLYDDVYEFEEIYDKNKEYVQLAEQLQLTVKKANLRESFDVNSIEFAVKDDTTRSVTITRTEVYNSSPNNEISGGSVTKTLRNVKLKDMTSVDLDITMSYTDKMNISFEVKNKPKDSKYNFIIRKVDEKGVIIKDSSVRIETDVYDETSITRFETMLWGNKVTLINEEGNPIDTSEQQTVNGEIKFENIQLDNSFAGKTYYFVVNETVQPANHTLLTYKIVVPIYFQKVDGIVVAKYMEPFALNRETGRRVMLDKQVNVNNESVGIVVTVPNKEIIKEGTFNLSIIKNIKGTNNPLKGAGFKIAIKNKATGEFLVDKNLKKVNGVDQYFTDDNGGLKLSQIAIENPEDTYVVTIEESHVPTGYLGISGKIEFEVKPRLAADGVTYELTSYQSQNIKNTKEIKVEPNSVVIYVENIPVPRVHKGIKDIKNQSSGYYFDEENAKNVEHDWVIQSEVPAGIDEFTKYIISDVIDGLKPESTPARLVYLTDSVSVKAITKDENGNESSTQLEKDKDFKVDYNESTRELNVIFINNEVNEEFNVEFYGGRDIPSPSTLEVRFKTKFATDDEGNIIGLNQAIENQAELIYSNTNEETRIPTEIPEVHTGLAQIYKYDEETNQALEGAEFKIATSKENAKQGKFVKDSKGNDIVAISNEKGIAKFVGLEFGEDALNKVKYYRTDPITGALVHKYDWTKVKTNYYIVETEAPIGYNKIDDIFEVEVSKDAGEIVEIKDMVSAANTKIPEPSKYNFIIRKVDENGVIIKDSSAKIETDVYDETSVTKFETMLWGNKVTLKNDEGQTIDISEQSTVNGEIKFENILIDDSFAGKTYYFVVNETVQPENHTLLSYKIVVPVFFQKEDKKVVAKYMEPFALNRETGRRIMLDKQVDVRNESVGIVVTVPNKEIIKEGTFNLSIIKNIKGTRTPLRGAGFKIAIKNKVTGEFLVDKNLKKVNGVDQYFTDDNGGLKLSQIAIENLEDTYVVTIEESHVPTGYLGISGKIEFEVKPRLAADGVTYELTSYQSQNIKNTKEIKVEPNSVVIYVENIPVPRVHKGIKDIKNQSSGYYFDEENAKNVEHDWVIQSEVPAGIDEFTKYIISDVIDGLKPESTPARLVYLTDSVSVKAITKDENGNESSIQLEKDKDFKVDYNESTRELNVIFINNEVNEEFNVEFYGGRDIPSPSTLEVRFKTKFATDDEGNIIGLNQAIENQAELIYSNTNEETRIPTEIPEVHTGLAQIYKYDKDTNQALEGAEFKIATSEENAKQGKFVKDSKGNDIVAISNEKGIAKFIGLEFGEDALNQVKYYRADPITGALVYKYDWTKVKTNYYIVETEAPIGYNKIDDIFEVEVSKDAGEIVEIKDMVSVANSKKIYDLALRKFITAVNDEEITSRIPKVDITPLVEGKTTAEYNHDKKPVEVCPSDIVTYTIRVYNEGPEAACARRIMDDIPQGLEFIPDHELNKEWEMYAEIAENENLEEEDIKTINYNGKTYKLTNDASKAKLIVTEQLSGKAIDGFDKNSMTDLDFEDVKVAFKVNEPVTSDRIIINSAQISDDSDSENEDIVDRDSTPNEWKDEDDEDTESVKVKCFDLALYKWVTTAIVTEDGKTVEYESGHTQTNKKNPVTVTIKKSKLDSVIVKFKYIIKVKNQNEISGYAKEIKDHIPSGLKFVEEDNKEFGWKSIDDKTIVTDYLKDKLLNKNDTAEVPVVLTWINNSNNLGEKINYAEISDDYNEYNDTDDIDSTPNNFVNEIHEDDEDKDVVVLQTKTGDNDAFIIALGFSCVIIIAIGVSVIKKYVLM